MAKAVLISEHAKRRAAERLELTRRDEIVHQFRNALMYGISPASFKGQFSTYLKKKLKNSRRCTIKVYCDFIYIHKGKRLVTMYPVPDKFLPVKQFLAKNYKNIEEKENIAELQLRRYFSSSEFKFYVKKPGKNGKTFTIALVIKEELVAVSQGKDLDKLKQSCVKQYFNDIKMGGEQEYEL